MRYETYIVMLDAAVAQQAGHRKAAVAKAVEQAAEAELTVIDTLSCHSETDRWSGRDVRYRVVLRVAP